MPANVETAVFANTPAWHGLGEVLDTKGNKGITVPVALQKSGLDWTVAKCPIYGPEGQLVEGRFGVQRSSDKSILGVVGKTWQPVQNIEGFQIIEDVIEQAGGKQVWIEAAGALDGGRVVWVLAHVDSKLQIAGESYKSYMLFTNGHNGRRAVTAAMLDVRVVCANTLEWGLNEATEDGRIVRVRHTVKASERIKEAHAILGMRNARLEELAKQGEWLVEQTLDDGEFAQFMDSLMPLPQDEDESPAKTMITNRRAKVAGLYFGAENLEPIRGTRWGALQAVTEYTDYHRQFTSAETQAKAQLGLTATPLKQQAFDLLYTAR